MVIEEKTGQAQALLYRLSGDWNPLHVDPEFARNFGFEQPILHGLCTFGYVGHHVIKAFCHNDPRRFKSIKVRFAKSVHPGDTLVTRMWKESDLRIVFETTVKERNEVVIKNAAVELYAEIPAPKPKAKAPAKEVAAPPARLLGADVFPAISRYIARDPDLAGQIKTLFQFNLSDPDSKWAVDLKSGNGEVRAGSADKPDATLSISDENFLAMCTGAADAQQLFFSGKLKISGNVMATAKLEFLKKLDPEAFDEAMNARTGAGSAAAPSAAEAKPAAPAAAVPPAAPRAGHAAEVFAALVERLAAHPQVAQPLAGKMLGFKLREPDAAWTLDCKGPRAAVEAGAAAQADTVFSLSDEDLIALVRGQAQAYALFRQGRLRVDGDMRLAHELTFLDALI